MPSYSASLARLWFEGVWNRKNVETIHTVRLLIRTLLLIAVASNCPAADVPAAPPAADGPLIVGYFAEWAGGRGYRVDNIPADKLTHVNYAFAVIKDGQCAIRNEPAAKEQFPKLRELKQKHPHLRTLISVGGWADSDRFSDAALTAESRTKFARSCADFASRHGFDGVDIDWEYPTGGGHAKNTSRPEDAHNFTLVLAELRKQLDGQGATDKKRYLLTIAAASSSNHARRMELEQIHPLLDFVNLMTYDFAGDWSPRTGFNAPLYAATDGGPSADASIRDYLAGGVPPKKLLLGVPFYGRAWGGVVDVNNGFDQPHTARPPRPQTGDGFSYRNLAAHYIDKSARRFWHERAKVPWLYDARTGLMVSYDDAQSLRHKAEYVREKGLSGAMIWEISEDDEKSSLLDALHAALHRRETEAAPR